MTKCHAVPAKTIKLSYGSGPLPPLPLSDAQSQIAGGASHAPTMFQREPNAAEGDEKGVDLSTEIAG